MVVGYLSEALESFRPPKDWIRTKRTVPTPVQPSQKKDSHPTQRPDLAEIVRMERQRSLEFETRLKNAVKRVAIAQEEDVNHPGVRLNSTLGLQ